VAPRAAVDAGDSGLLSRLHERESERGRDKGTGNLIFVGQNASLSAAAPGSSRAFTNAKANGEEKETENPRT